MGELLLVAPDAPAGLRCLSLGDRRLGNAHDQATEQFQHQRRIGMAHAAAIFIEGNIQRIMQPAFIDSIAAFEFDPAQRIELFEGQAADEIHGFGRLAAPAPHAPSQSPNQAGAGKTDLFESHFPAFQSPDLTPAPVVFAGQCPGLSRGSKGKICPASGASPGFEPVPSGCP